MIGICLTFNFINVFHNTWFSIFVLTAKNVVSERKSTLIYYNIFSSLPKHSSFCLLTIRDFYYTNWKDGNWRTISFSFWCWNTILLPWRLTYSLLTVQMWYNAYWLELIDLKFCFVVTIRCYLFTISSWSELRKQLGKEYFCYLKLASWCYLHSHCHCSTLSCWDVLQQWRWWLSSVSGGNVQSKWRGLAVYTMPSGDLDHRSTTRKFHGLYR